MVRNQSPYSEKKKKKCDSSRSYFSLDFCMGISMDIFFLYWYVEWMFQFFFTMWIQQKSENRLNYT